MKKIKLNVILLLLSFVGFSLNSFAQCKSDTPDKKRAFFEIETECAKANSESSFLTDGKEYRALLSNNEASDFVVVFFANNTYRVAACTDIGGPLSFIVRDKRKNILFSNKDYENAPYWDLSFPTSIECIVTVSLPEETRKLANGGTIPEEPSTDEPTEESGDSAKTTDAEPAESTKTSASASVSPVCSVLLIGYKQE